LGGKEWRKGPGKECLPHYVSVPLFEEATGYFEGEDAMDI
jgi:hypothetical protein